MTAAVNEFRQFIGQKAFEDIVYHARHAEIIDSRLAIVARAVLSDGTLGHTPNGMPAEFIESAVQTLVDLGLVVREGDALRRADYRQHRPTRESSVNVLAIWEKARADARLDQPARRIICQIARVGFVERPDRLARSLDLTSIEVARSVRTLRALNYLPSFKPDAKKGNRHYDRTAA